MLKFGNPENLWLLLLIPLAALLFAYAVYAKKKTLRRFAEEGLISTLIGEKSYVKETLRAILLMLALLAFILAAAAPKMGTKIEEVKQLGIDIFIGLDVSKSMLATDVRPTRLENAKNEINKLIRQLRGDRIGLVVFAGDAYLQFPLTSDAAAAALFLSTVDQTSVPRQGTNLATAVNVALKSFVDTATTKKVIILISDGEDHEGGIDEAINAAKEKDVVIYTIGFGSPDGAPIPDEFSGSYKTDESGNPILSRLNEGVLKDIANATDGKYLFASGDQDELELILEDIAQMEKTELGSMRITDFEDIYYYFIAIGILFLITEMLLSDFRSKIYQSLFQQKKNNGDKQDAI